MRTKFSKWFHNPWISLGVIGLLTFLAYSNVFHNPFFMDDHDFIVDWSLVQDWNNMPQFFLGYAPPPGQEGVFSPVKTLIHAINYHLFGLDPFGHHVFAFVNYLFSIVIVYKIGMFFLRDRLSTFLCALLFALHPVHIEYVSSLTGSVDAVGVNFMFVSFYFYIKGQSEDGGLDRKLYLLSLMFALAAIYLHELCITLPVMFLCYDACFLSKKIPYRKTFLRTLPLFLFSASYVLAKYLTLGAITRGHYLYDNFYLTMLVTVKAWAKYVYISFFPVTLTFNHVISKGIYSFDQDDFDRISVLSQSIFDPQVLGSLFVLGCIGYFGFKSFKKNPLITFCIGWFFIGVLPGANIVPSGVYFAERYLYPGSLGFCLLFGWSMNKLFQNKKRFLKIRVSTIAALMTIMITVYCGIRIWVRNLDGKTEMALYESAVRANPKSALMRTDLGIIYIRHQFPEKAVESFKEALKIRLDDPVIYFTMADAYTVMGENGKAKEALKKAIVIDPHYADAYYNLAGICAVLGEVSTPWEYLDKSLYYYREQGENQKADKYGRLFRGYFGAPYLSEE
ncbi:MAG: tetratricopeptide repeat protein [Candidatus Omnitrophica bacterium]|nr:tetratricopeptide repeat protein [Candidatus Omnitrophota bacterium]